MADTRPVTRLLRALALCVGAALCADAAHANKIGMVFLKNNHHSDLLVWINGYYQGKVEAGKICYTLYEGFTTRDSGFNAEGKLVVKRSHAGWDSSGSEIRIYAVGRGKKPDEPIYWYGSFPNEGKGSNGYMNTSEYYVWFGPPEWNDADRERAEKIPPGSADNLKIVNVDMLGPADPDIAKDGGAYGGSTDGVLPALMWIPEDAVVITAPSQYSKTTGRTANVSGIVKYAGIQSVLLSNGDRVELIAVKSGQFSATIALNDGDNTITARLPGNDKVLSKVTIAVAAAPKVAAPEVYSGPSHWVPE